MSFKVVIYGESHANTWLYYFYEGLKRHGVDAFRQPHGTFKGAELVVSWGHRRHDIIKRQKKDGNDYLVMERGYFGDRFNWTSLGFNGLNGMAEFHNENSPPDRWRPHAHLMKPWKHGGEYVLLLGQVAGDASLDGTDINRWCEETATRLKWILQKAVVFRPHPLSRQTNGIDGVRTINGSLKDALSGAFLAVTFNSNSGVDAVLAGVPTVACDRGSMAWPVTKHTVDMEDMITRPDREQWAHNLAYCQWKPAEISNGSAWEHLKQRYE